MGVKKNHKTQDFEEWHPLNRQLLDPVNGLDFYFSRLNWKLFRDVFTIYVCLTLFLTAQAWALSPKELDALVPTIIAAESSGNPKAVGDNGRARGLMQIQKATWNSMTALSWDNAFDPALNKQIGRQILERINKVYNDSYGVNAARWQIVSTYNTGHYYIGVKPAWLKKHPNKIYRAVFNE